MVKTTNLRLNLDKPEHRKAYEILQNSEMSHTKTIVAALLSFSENEENRKHLFDGIREIVLVKQNCNTSPKIKPSVSAKV